MTYSNLDIRLTRRRPLGDVLLARIAKVRRRNRAQLARKARHKRDGDRPAAAQA